MHLRSFLARFFACILLGLSCSAGAFDSLRIALIPAEDAREMTRQSRHLLAALERNMAAKVEGFVAADYNGVIESLRAGHVDVAYLGPFSYVKAAEVANVEAFAVAKIRHQKDSSYRSQIVVRANSNIQSLEELRARNFAFVDPTSTSGYVFPLLGLKEAGLNPRKDFRNIVYTGGHDANLLALKHGRVDAVAVADRILESALEKGLIDDGELRIIWSSGEIPESPMVWRTDLSEEHKQRILKAFLDIRNIPFGDQGYISEYRVTDDRSYDVVRKAARLVRN